MQAQTCRGLLPSGGCGIRDVDEGLDGTLVKGMKVGNAFHCEGPTGLSPNLHTVAPVLGVNLKQFPPSSFQHSQGQTFSSNDCHLRVHSRQQ